ncbi:hypothetical protein HYN59_14340 [Flavobacterium album]|uniref:Uncharacterized protein n=1 Tax=Flavobacterium album TaxID=2175091 RepID=A0A2S1R0R1_9FLAO|nr:hypothetical protein [Flavobacterium album]AWH86215.1 hypothetical protein HYN59_14340 [Flavobacterium album]
MGLIILPFILGAIFMFINAAVKTIKSILAGNVNPKDYGLGFLLSAIIYIPIFLSYKLSDSAYALGAYFVFPFFMIGIPFLIGFSMSSGNNEAAGPIAKICLLSVVFRALYFDFQSIQPWNCGVSGA